MPDTVSVLPPDLQDLVDACADNERVATALVDPLDNEQLNWAPEPGRWSIGQCVAHLNHANELYLAGIQTAVARARQAGHVRRGPIQSSWFGRQFIASVGPDGRRRMRAPGRIRPAPRLLKAEIWPQFVRLHELLRSLVATEGLAVDLNRAWFWNPFLPVIRMRAGTALRIVAAHDRRHLLQAGRVREAPGFPRS